MTLRLRFDLHFATISEVQTHVTPCIVHHQILFQNIMEQQNSCYFHFCSCMKHAIPGESRGDTMVRHRIYREAVCQQPGRV